MHDMAPWLAVGGILAFLISCHGEAARRPPAPMIHLRMRRFRLTAPWWFWLPFLGLIAAMILMFAVS